MSIYKGLYDTITDLAGGNGWTPEDLEIYINNVHDEFMLSPTCGFDQWIDNHFAIDANPFSGG